MAAAEGVFNALPFEMGNMRKGKVGAVILGYTISQASMGGEIVAKNENVFLCGVE